MKNGPKWQTFQPLLVVSDVQIQAKSIWSLACHLQIAFCTWFATTLCTVMYFAYLQFMSVVNMQKYEYCYPPSCLLKRQGYVCKYFRFSLTVAIWKIRLTMPEKIFLLCTWILARKKVTSFPKSGWTGQFITSGYIRRRCDCPLCSSLIHFWKVSCTHHGLWLSPLDFNQTQKFFYKPLRFSLIFL